MRAIAGMARSYKWVGNLRYTIRRNVSPSPWLGRAVARLTPRPDSQPPALPRGPLPAPVSQPCSGNCFPTKKLEQCAIRPRRRR